MNDELELNLFVHPSAFILHNSFVPVSPARHAAYSILMRLRAGRSFAVDLLQSGEVAGLNDADQRLATEIVMGVLRWQGALDLQIELLSAKPLSYFDPEVLTILRMSIYQRVFLTKIPSHAVVNEAVELTKAARKSSASGLVNAVLRKAKPMRAGDLYVEIARNDPTFSRWVRAATPRWMLERWEHQYGPDAAFALAYAANQIPPATLRTRAGEREAIARQLGNEGIETSACRFAPHALTVRAGGLRKSRAFQNGEVVIQDEASQLVPALLAVRRGDRVLDLCAAPGIKTAQIAEALGAGTLVSCDVSAARLATMKRLIAGSVPHGVDHTLLRLDTSRRLPFERTFDRILVDAPCSGTGTLARNPEIKWKLEAKELVRLSRLQAAILGHALEVLAPGGRLVYATCSLEPEENECVVEKALAAAPGCQGPGREELEREFPAWAELFDSSGTFRTRPDLHGMDGFFAAVIERNKM